MDAMNAWCFKSSVILDRLEESGDSFCGMLLLSDGILLMPLKVVSTKGKKDLV
jgi:hypothetical protein